MHHALRELAWSLLDSGFRELCDAEKAGERTPEIIRTYVCTIVHHPSAFCEVDHQPLSETCALVSMDSTGDTFISIQS